MSRALYITTPVLDDCRRANESPLSNGGAWADLGDTTLVPSAVGARLLSNRITTTNVSFTATALWTRASFSDCEVWADWSSTLASVGGYIFLRFANIGSGTTDGYRLSLGGGSASIQRIDNSVATTLRSAPAVTAYSGRIMFRAVGSHLSMHRPIGTDIPENWVEIIGVDDANYTTGQIGLISNTSYSGFNTFGGGSTSGLFSGMPIAAPIAGRGATW